LGKKAGLPKFTVPSGIAAPLDIQNINTDMIIPIEFLKTMDESTIKICLMSTRRNQLAAASSAIDWKNLGGTRRSMDIATYQKKTFRSTNYVAMQDTAVRIPTRD
jgi:3-isopropylmalate dehydratase small subunit